MNNKLKITMVVIAILCCYIIILQPGINIPEADKNDYKQQNSPDSQQKYLTNHVNPNDNRQKNISNPDVDNHNQQQYPVARLYPLYADIKARFNIQKKENIILIDGKNQKLYLANNSENPLQVVGKYPISSGKNGFGTKKGSGKTPVGIHKIKEKHGDNAAPGTIFVFRENTGEIATIITEEKDKEHDIITSRILWLEGLESHNSNTYSRHIYIHGTNEEGLIGEPHTNGCIRMKNKDVIELYNLVKEDTLVNIADQLP